MSHLIPHITLHVRSLAVITKGDNTFVVVMAPWFDLSEVLSKLGAQGDGYFHRCHFTFVWPRPPQPNGRRNFLATLLHARRIPSRRWRRLLRLPEIGEFTFKL